MMALLDEIGPSALLVQPHAVHPRCRTICFRPDLGVRKVGINWGIFNFFWPTTVHRVRKTLRRRNPALVIMTSIWDYHALSGYCDVPVVLDAHNVDAVVMAEQFGRHHPFTAMVRSWERRVVRRVDHLFACSDHDQVLFREMYGIPEQNITVVPNAVDIKHFSLPRQAVAPDIAAALNNRTVLFFMGKLDYQPNREALRFMCEKLLPALEQVAPDRFKLLVCGRPVPPAIQHPALVYAGHVNDLRPYIHRADLCLAPLFSGSGTRFKIIEYLACRKPVISTAKGAEGLGCTHGEHLYLAEKEAFADAVLHLAEHPEDAAALGERGYERARERFDWSAVKPLWRDEMNRLLPSDST
jgi:glycosyltransferase involved in cell wall biosynthesis